jgi:LPXTG-site transpeptidase (sortase) family protein
VVIFLVIPIVKGTFVYAATAPNLGTAGNFSALAKTSMDLSGGGSMSLDSNLGISTGDSGSLTGIWNALNKYFSDTPAPNNLVASNAIADALTAYNNLASQVSSGVWTWALSRHPPPGVWDIGAGDPYVNGIITLNGDYDDVWVFRFAGNLYFMGSVVMAGNAQPCHVFWQVGNIAGVSVVAGEVSYNKNFFGTKIANADEPARFQGTLISNNDVTFTNALNTEGRLISLNGSLLMQGSGLNSFISNGACATPAPPVSLPQGGGPLIVWPPDVVEAVTKMEPIPPALPISPIVVSTPTPISVASTAVPVPKWPKTGFPATFFKEFNNFFNFKNTTQNNLSASATEAITPSNESGQINKVPLAIRLKIPKIKVDANIESVGIVSDESMDVPKNFTDVAWFNLGPRPGLTGNAVIDGHSGRKNNAPAVFDDLYKLKKGDKIYTEDENGVNTTFIVRESQKYDLTTDTKDVFVSSDGKSHLNLITCAGIWNPILGTHSERLVIFTDKEI